MQEFKIGLLGLGTVGMGVVKLLRDSAAVIEQRLQKKLMIPSIAVKNLRKERSVLLDDGVLTDDALSVIKDPDIQVIVEVIGGCGIAKDYVLAALNHKKHVVTANKALIAEHGQEILKTAKENHVSVHFEASVAGGIPIIRTLRDGLVANQTHSIYGIINGTANFILSKMSDECLDFGIVLKEAQRKGYAEADPTLDINGMDAAHKIQILTLLGFGVNLTMDQIFVEGIQNIRVNDVVYAKELGYQIKLLAIAKEQDHAIEVRVHPTLIPKDHSLSSVRGVYNAVCIQGNAVGQGMYVGLGAGDMPTASSVLSDVIDIARDPARQFPGHETLQGTSKKIRTIHDVVSKYYLRFSVIDQPGVLASIATILGQHDISIASVIQKERSAGEAVPLIIMTHEAKESEMQDALAKINLLPVMKDQGQMIRVEML